MTSPDIEWDRLPTGEPHYPGATEWLHGRISSRFDVNGSTLVLVEAVQAKPRDEIEEARQPLVHHHRTWHALSEPSTTRPGATTGNRPSAE